MKTLSLAWRNILRNRRRSLLTLAAIAVGSLAILLFGGYVISIVRVLHTDTVRGVGHLQIQQKGQLDFGRANPGRFAIHDYEALMQILRSDAVLGPRLAVITPVLSVQGVAGNFAAGMSSTFAGQGVIPAEQNAMQRWDGLQTGRAPGKSSLPEDKGDNGIIGRGLAQLLALCGSLAIDDCTKLPDTDAGADTQPAASLPEDIAALSASVAPPSSDKSTGPAIELLAASPGGAPNVVRMGVLKAERQGVRELDNILVGMPLGLAQKLVFGAGPGAVSSIVLQLHDSDDLDVARLRIEAMIAERNLPLEVHDFHVINPSYDQVINLFQAIFRFISFIMGIVALFSVANAVNMAVSERIGEIGTLRALGFQQTHIRRLFVTEGALLGLCGTALGGVLALILAQTINHAGLGWTPPGRTTPVPLWVDVLGDPRLLTMTVIAMVLLAAFSSWLPARRGARLEVVEALRHV